MHPASVLQRVRHGLTEFGVIASRPWAFALVAAYGVAWLHFDRASFGWHGFAVLATWLMTLVIQRAEHRDTRAIHAKLDVHAQRAARQFPELLVAAVAVEAANHSLGADAETFIALVHEQGSYG